MNKIDLVCNVCKSMWKLCNVFNNLKKNGVKKDKLYVKDEKKKMDSETDKFVGEYLFDSGL